MAILLPISQKTVELLSKPPTQGNTHRWLAQVANGLKHVVSAEDCFRFLRRTCDEFVTHRTVPDREIEAAVDFAYSGKPVAKPNLGRQPVEWPEPSLALIESTLQTTPPVCDVTQPLDISAGEVLSHLFRPGELVCSGRNTERASVRPLEETIADANWLQFVVVNPMRGLEAPNYQGRMSPRCQNNTGLRRHLVVEFDNPGLGKHQQASLLGHLAQVVPLVLVVDSGGKSLHGWFRVDQLSRQDQVRFFCLACLLAADPSRWDVCGWLRMPGGLRVVDGVPSVRQHVLHFNPKLCRG